METAQSCQMLLLTAVVSHFQSDIMRFKASRLLPRSGSGAWIISLEQWRNWTTGRNKWESCHRSPPPHTHLFYSQAISLACMHSWWNSVSQITVSVLGIMQGHFSPVLGVQPNGDKINTEVTGPVSLAHDYWRWKQNILVILTCIYSEPHYLIQNENYIPFPPNPVLLSP